MLVPLVNRKGKKPMINKGTLAKKEQITLMALRFLYFCTSHIESNWNTLVSVGKAASKPIWKFDAFNKTAIATRKVPPVKVAIASAAKPSWIKCFKPDCTCWSLKVVEGRSVIVLVIIILGYIGLSAVVGYVKLVILLIFLCINDGGLTNKNGKKTFANV